MGQLFLWIFLLIVGFALLVKGADWFVEGSAGVAGKCHVSPLVIGLTVVAFGTSMPELAASVASAISHETDISIGNVVGSNIANILLILGLSSVIRALPVKRNSLFLDLPVLLLASGLLIGLGAWNDQLEWWDGLIMVAVFAVYLWALFYMERRDQRVRLSKEVQSGAPLQPAVPPEEVKKPKGRFGLWMEKMEEKMWFLLLLTAVGLGMVVGGGTLLVEGATFIAEYFNVHSNIIGLTVVAIGTSLPELVTSVVAAVKGETDIAVGNIIGSNIFNILFVAGVSSFIYPLAFVEHNLIDGLVALGAAVLLFVCVLPKGHKLGRTAGVVMLLGFVAYYVYLFAVRLPALPPV